MKTITTPEGTDVSWEDSPLKQYPLTPEECVPQRSILPPEVVARLKREAAERRKARPHGNIKCNCGHTARDHHNGEGWCHSSGHPREGQCGCTWYYPNDKWIIKNRKKEKE